MSFINNIKVSENIDKETIKRRLILDKLSKMTPDEIFQIAVRAGIYTVDGELTEDYGGPKGK